jgi:DNA-binding transcriptional MocR family regulator
VVLAEELFDEALKHGICFAPGDAFSTSDRYTHCLRLSCGYHWHPRIEEGLKILGNIASAALNTGT